MKKCPCCESALQRDDYEGFGIETCPDCAGTLVRKSNMTGIKRTPEKTAAALVQEAQSFSKSTNDDLSCPACFRPMEKIRTTGFPNVEYDSCTCGAHWFDAGELAMMQLFFENSNKGKIAESSRKRAEEFANSPERQRRFEENLRACISRDYSPLGSIAAGAFDAAYHCRHRRKYR